MVQRLLEGLQILSHDEQALIQALYFDGLTEREWSEILDTSQTTINDRKGRILLKLMKFMEAQK